MASRSQNPSQFQFLSPYGVPENLQNEIKNAKS